MSVLEDTGVVVIGRNEGERLERCLRSVIGRVGLVVYVDSGSTDSSVAYARSLGVDVVELDMSRPFTAARARNEGLCRLRRIEPSVELVQFVDGDCVVRDEWLEFARLTLLNDNAIAVVCGRRRELFPDASIFNLLCDLEWDTPVGKTHSCGGDAMMRIEAFESVDGFDGSIIAGEEPELCFRLRERGWEIWRLDAEMTLHDAAILSFIQWWRRATRGGHAFAQGAWMHGFSRERFNVRPLVRIIAWGGLVPIITIILMLSGSPFWAPAFGAYFVQGWRIRRTQLMLKRTPREANVYAMFTILDKFAALIGALRYLGGKMTNNASAIIEYKGK